MFVAVTALLVPIVHFKMEHSENAEREIFGLFSILPFSLTCHGVEVVDEGDHEDGLGSQKTDNQSDVDPGELWNEIFNKNHRRCLT